MGTANEGESRWATEEKIGHKHCYWTNRLSIHDNRHGHTDRSSDWGEIPRLWNAETVCVWLDSIFLSSSSSRYKKKSMLHGAPVFVCVQRLFFRFVASTAARAACQPTANYTIIIFFVYIDIFSVVEVETICDDAEQILLTADQTFWASFSESPAVFSAAEHANKATERRPKKIST